MSTEIILAIIGTIFLIGSNLVWLITFFMNKVEKKTIERREFGHLKNNQKQMSDGLVLILDTIKERFDILGRDILEIKFTLGLKDRNQDD